MQEHIWEKEYQSPQLITLGVEPLQAVKDFVRFVRKEQKLELSHLALLDLGCGNAKNSLYISEQGYNNTVTGIDISETALKHAREVVPRGHFIKHNIGCRLPFPDSSFDIILDSTSSNSLNEAERAVYMSEIGRLLKPDGYLFLRTLCKDGDKNAHNLLKQFPGTEKDTYILPGLGLTERVFSREDLEQTYAPLGNILYMEKETHYTRFAGKSYRRNFWTVYVQKHGQNGPFVL